MKRPTRSSSDNMYHINGKTYKVLHGSREQVMNKTAYKTPGGLEKKDLVKNRWGRIVSLKKMRTAKKEMRLQKHGYFAQKGKFGYVKRDTMKSRSKSSSKKGGDASASVDKSSLNMSDYSAPVMASAK